MSLARNSTPARSAPKNFTERSVRDAGSTCRSRSGGITHGTPSGTAMSSPWMTSWLSAPANPPPGGFHGWFTLSATAAVSSATGKTASRRASRSAIALKLPRDFASSSMNFRPLYLNGIVMCATASRTRQPAHSVGASHSSAGSAASKTASSPRVSATIFLISSSIDISSLRDGDETTRLT